MRFLFSLSGLPGGSACHVNLELGFFPQLVALLQLSPAAPVELLQLMQVTTVTKACVKPQGIPISCFFPHRPWAPSSSPRSSCSVKPSRTCRGPRHAPTPWPASSRSTAPTLSARRQSSTSSTSASTTSASRSTTGVTPGQERWILAVELEPQWNCRRHDTFLGRRSCRRASREV